MAFINWPSQLEDKLDQDSFSFEFANNTISSENDSGPSKKRRVSTASPDIQSCSILLHRDEFTHLETFYKYTTGGGTLRFNFTHPFKDTAIEARFRGPPSVEPIGGLYYRVTMSWEIFE